MTDSTGYKKPAGARDVDFAHYTRHYGALLWRWKWWIVFSAPVAAGLVIALLLYKVKNTVPPSLPATVTLGGAVGGEATTGQVKVENSVGDDESEAPDTLAQTALIRSREFLRGVVDDLSLRLRVNRFPRSSIFDTIVVDSLAPSGKYRFVIDGKSGNSYRVFRKSLTFGVHSLFYIDRIADGTLSLLDTLRLPGVHLRFSRWFLHHPCNFKFSVINTPEAVESLRDSVSFHASSPTMAERYPSFSITVTGNDYNLDATLVNTIADKFVAKNIRSRQMRSQSLREILTQQLDKAKSELAESEEKLKTFRMDHPTIGLSQSSEEMLSSSVAAEHVKDSVAESMNSALLLQKKLRSAPDQNLPQLCSEILGFLVSQKDNAAPFLSTELSRLVGERHRLEGAYDADHPDVLKNKAEIRQMIEKVVAALQNFIEDRKQLQMSQQGRILELSQKIQALPSEEQDLSELSRMQQIKADIYAKLLDKFYQASVSDVTEMPDFYVMDYASPPIPPPQKLDSKALALGAFFALFLVFGPLVLVDLTSKTVRTELELKKMLDIDFIESIPKMTLDREAGNGPGRLSNKLIVRDADDQHDHVKEMFRLLRMKIMLRFHGGGSEKTLVVTSLESNVGKSTIASNIAIAMAQQNLKTALIDGDLRLGTIHHLFNINKSPGLSEFLRSDRATGASAGIAIHHPPAIPNLTVISSGASTTKGSELMATDRFRLLVKTLIRKNDIVIFDSPPISIVADALSVNQLFSHYLLVIRAGQTNIVDLREKIAENSPLRSKLMGVVLNFAAIDRKMQYYKQSKYYFQGKQPEGA